MLQTFLNFLNTSGFVHNALLAPLFLILGDFITGVASALKNKNFQFTDLANILGFESDLLKYVVGAVGLFVANGLHLLGPELNTFFGTSGSIALCVTILASVLNNLIELLPAAWQPEAKALEGQVINAIESDVSQIGAGGQPVAAPAPAVVQAPVPVDAQATVSVPAVPQYSMPSGL